MSRPKTARAHHKRRGGAPMPEVYIAPATTESPNALRLLEARNRAVARAEGLSAIISFALAELDAAANKGDPDPLELDHSE